MSGAHLSNRSLTGERRFRSERRWGREKLILQVQERGMLSRYIGGRVETDSVIRWRDATTEDMGWPQPSPGDSHE